jgi:hypothetical protein
MRRSLRSHCIGRSWEPDAASGYLYNAVHRHYFQPKTGMYYGGDPPAWTLKPSIPAEALYSNGSTGEQGRGTGRYLCSYAIADTLSAMVDRVPAVRVSW